MIGLVRKATGGCAPTPPFAPGVALASPSASAAFADAKPMACTLSASARPVRLADAADYHDERLNARFGGQTAFAERRAL